jgi:CARDB
MHREALTFLMISLLTGVLNGCAVPEKRPPLADLVPSKSPGQPDNIAGFCKVIDKVMKVVVSVKNQGNAGSPVSTTTVQFATGQSFNLATPAILPGGSAHLDALNIPAACFNPDCNFTITVDSGNQVKESNAKNNTANGRCIR